MSKWQRINYQPVLPLGEDGKRLTGSKEHIELSRKAASEGMVLLKNTNDALPLSKGAKVVLLGKGTIDFVKGGGGSGDVTCAYVRTIAEGMLAKEAEGKLSVFPETIEFYKNYVEEQHKQGYTAGMMKEAVLPAELIEKAKAFADVAVVSVSRYSGEGWDRGIDESDDIRTEYTMWPGEEEQRESYREVFNSNDFYLTKEEQQVIDIAKSNFKQVIVVLNVGGMIDTNWTFDEGVDSVLLSWQGGMEGGLATADVLCGDVNPSGHLSDTFAKKLTDYPSTEGFHDSADYVLYTDDIYVGYRYFCTIPGAAEKVNYPFGFGLSYTNFDIKTTGAECKDGVITFKVQVTNTGARPGKEVVQLYYSAPQAILHKPARELAAFAKTKEIMPGQSEMLELQVKVNDMKSYDDTGKIKDASWVLEKGEYSFYIGANVRDAVKADYTYELAENVVLETTGHKVSPVRAMERIISDGTREAVKPAEPKPDTCGLTRQGHYDLEGIQPGIKGLEQISILKYKYDELQLIDVYYGKITIDEFINSLSIEERADILGGQINTGVANTSGVGNNRMHGIPNVMTADGPAGLRIIPQVGVTTTAWPIAMNLACTWDIELIEHVGKEIALEIKENNLGLWLAPACNIHRSPLCGRNFEYFSEDPYLTGKAATAIVRGTQSQNIGATPKHFAANNKETNRKASDSVVSERALREIYLKQFEMIVKEAKPYLIMSSYNKINGIYASENTDLLTGILRDEWGYEGPVTTDWWTLCEQYMEVKAGNDLKMATGYPKRLLEAYDKGLISEAEINKAVKRILEMILKID